MSERSERIGKSGTPIVVGYDGSPAAEAALCWAAAEAGRLGAAVRVVLVLQWPAQLAALMPGPSIYPDQRAQHSAEKLVRQAAESVRRQQPGLEVTGRVRVGATVPDLVAESCDARVLVLGHRGHDGLPSRLLGSVGVAVSAQAHCPVVIIRGSADGDAGTGAANRNDGWALDPVLARTQRVLVGFDGSPCASQAVGVAFQAASARRVGVRVLHAWRPPVPRWKADTNVDPLAGRWGDREVEDQLDDLALAEQIAVVDAIQPWRRRYPRVPVTVDLVADSAEHALAAASTWAHLVVVGCCRHGSLHRLLFGSVSRHLVHHAGCPVVVVHELPQNEVSAASA